MAMPVNGTGGRVIIESRYATNPKDSNFYREDSKPKSKGQMM